MLIETNFFLFQISCIGLPYELEKEEPDLQRVEHLLKSWCFIKITNENRGKINLMNVVEKRESLERKNALLQLLRKFDVTSEFVAVCLAGSVNWMKKCYERGNFPISI